MVELPHVPALCSTWDVRSKAELINTELQNIIANLISAQRVTTHHNILRHYCRSFLDAAVLLRARNDGGRLLDVILGPAAVPTAVSWIGLVLGLVYRRTIGAPFYLYGLQNKRFYFSCRKQFL